MVIRENQINAEIANIYRKLIKNKRYCQVNGCESYAINSHVLSKSKVLKPISNKGHLYEISRNNPRKIFLRDQFVETGINEILSFKCFCKEHDNRIFQRIEDEMADLNDTKNQILYLIRAVFFERYKKEINEEFYLKLGEEGYMDPNSVDFNSFLRQNALGIKDMSYYIKQLNKQYNDGIENYLFYTFELPRHEVVMSGIFNVEMEADIVYLPNGELNPDPPNSIVVSFFPTKNRSIFICGFESKYMENFKFVEWMRDKNLNKKIISDIMIQRLESWATSKKFYEDQIKQREVEFFKEFRKMPSRFLQKSSLSINLLD